MAARRKPDRIAFDRDRALDDIREAKVDDAAPDMAMLADMAMLDPPEADPEMPLEPLTHAGRPCVIQDAWVQYSPEWWEARRGVPTASSFDRIIQPTKGLYSGAASKYIAQLVAETIHMDPGAMTERPMNPAMRHGIETEAEARKWYEMHTECDVRQVGFVVSGCGRFGCSPDGLVGEDGLLELKCPQPATHVEYLMERVLPNEYKAQVHGQLLVTGRKWVDFMSYAAMYPPFVIRIVPDEFTVKLRKLLERFAADYAATLSKFS